jgi:hypothetical protein
MSNLMIVGIGALQGLEAMGLAVTGLTEIGSCPTKTKQRGPS